METRGNDTLIISNWGIQEAAPTQGQGNSEGGDRLVGVPINCAMRRSSGIGLFNYKYMLEAEGHPSVPRQLASIIGGRQVAW